uniref:ATP synthase complex subunit 8 n=1 Tax=Curculionidae sp. BMNH 1039956 TaxID=1903770 RepID=A0A343A5S7_9CUCU|nr:ATP synthase F0 subunit 8 [Curculionidae sp. BMNH 1039956]
MPQMSPYNWSIYFTLIVLFLVLMVIMNYFSNIQNIEKKNNFELNKPKSTNWKW